MEAIGVIEVVGNTMSIKTSDIIVKNYGLKILTTEKALGGRLVSVVVEGSISNVESAIEELKSKFKIPEEIASYSIINNPHEVVQSIVQKSMENLGIGD